MFVQFIISSKYVFRAFSENFSTLVMPIFHYADFVTKYVTSRRLWHGHKSWKFVTQIQLLTFIICVVDFRDLCPRQSRWTSLSIFPVHFNRLNSIRATQMGLSWTLSQTSRHVEIICDFHDLFSPLSPKLHDFMLCHHLCPQLFMICVHNFPHEEVLVKVGVMEFGLKA